MDNDVFASVFRAILTMSVTGGIIALALFALKPLLRNRLPKTAQYCLWIVALAAFLIPASTFVAVPNPGGGPTVSGFIEQRVFSGSEYVERQMLAHTGHSAQISLSEAERMSAEDKEQTVQVRADARTQEFWLNFLVTKMPFIGALSILFTNLLGYWSFLLRLREGNKRYETACPVPVFRNAEAATPMLIGLFRPYIVLPHREYTQEQLRSILLHELTHLRRKDILVKWLSVLACSVHWFNPIVWFVRREIDRACELACDAAVIRKLDAAGRQNYGDTLIAVAADSKIPRTVLSTTMCQRKKSLKERLGAIMSYKKSTPLALICSAALVILLTGCAALLGAGEGNRRVDEITGSDDPRFRGVVEVVYDEAILVRVNEGEEIRKSSDLINVALANANPDANSGYLAGDRVCVYFDGVIAESYPAQVSAYAVLIEEFVEGIGYISNFTGEMFEFDEIEWLTDVNDGQRLTELGLNETNTPSLNNGFAIYNPDDTTQNVGLTTETLFRILEDGRHKTVGAEEFAQNLNKHEPLLSTPYRVQLADGKSLAGVTRSIALEITEQYLP
jgi:beta-lactamase regulating signal transducer with metallopeptidase domain